jgi:uncharacterized protein DUF3298/peptidoglycan-N-acetylmuramic acid deacetylase PdaC-like protein
MGKRRSGKGGPPAHPPGGKTVTKRTSVVFSVVQIVGYILTSYASLPTPLAAHPEVAVDLQEYTLSQHNDGWSIDIKYPAIEGADAFNTAVRQQVEATAEGFRRSLPKTASKDYPDYGAYLKGTYRAQVLKNGIVTVLFQYDEYTPGAVHPWGLLTSINYDKRFRQVLALSDLFSPGCNYVSRLSRISIQSLEEHEYAEKTAIRHGAGPVENNFQVFTLTDTELVLHFQQYQVAPGAMPSEEVAIPLTRLAPLLRKPYLTGQ